MNRPPLAALVAVATALLILPTTANAKFAYQPEQNGLTNATGTPGVASLDVDNTALVWRDNGAYGASTQNDLFFSDLSKPDGRNGDTYSCGGYALGTTKASSDPSVVSWGTGRLDVFARGSSGNVIHYYKNGANDDCTPTWSAAENRGGGIVGRPAAVSRASKQLEVYARGTNNQLYEQSWSATGGWSAWTALGGSLVAAPAAASWSTATTVIGEYSGGVLYSKRWDSGKGWGAWTSLASAMGSIRAAGAPTAASTGANNVDVVFRATNGHLYSMAFRGASWGAPEDLGVNAGNTDPTASEHGSSVGDLFTGNPDSADTDVVQRRILDPYGDTSLIYSALGDSYGSGQGTRDYELYGAWGDSDPRKTDCKRSPESYAIERSGSFHADYGRTWFEACSGATTQDVTTYQVPYIHPGTKVVTLSVGGDDADFSTVVNACVNPIATDDCEREISAARDEITNELPGRLDALYAKIAAKAPAGGYLRVVVVGYPRLFQESFCKATGVLTNSEAADLNDTGDLLDATIKAAVARQNNPTVWRFADPRALFDQHRVCSSNGEWINGISDPTTESFHPNATGYDHLGDLVVQTAGIDF